MKFLFVTMGYVRKTDIKLHRRTFFMQKRYSIGKYTVSVLLAGTIAFAPVTAGSVFAHGAPDEDVDNAVEVNSGESTEAGHAILDQGEQGQEVTDLQQKLQDEGYDVSSDGIYGQNLQDKIIDFQYAQGWDADGVVDAPTLNALGSETTVEENDSTNESENQVSNNQGSNEQGNDDSENNSDDESPNEPTVMSQTINANSGDAVADAEALEGTPYAMGGTNPETGLDSSGFINAVFSDKGLSRTHAGMWENDGEKVENPAPGDVVFFEGTYKDGVSHSGVYTGNGQMIHAGTEKTGVEETSMDIDYWNDKYIGAKRF